MPEFNIRKVERWLSVDPGIKGTGVAFWSKDEFKNVITITPDDREADWLLRARSVADIFSYEVTRFEPEIIYIEEPFVSLRSGKTLAAAASNSVTKLCIAAGCLIGIADSIIDDITVELISPKVWKGQLSDEMLERRLLAWSEKNIKHGGEKLREYLQYDAISEHAKDSAAIGLHVLKEL